MDMKTDYRGDHKTMMNALALTFISHEKQPDSNAGKGLASREQQEKEIPVEQGKHGGNLLNKTCYT